MKTLLLGLGVFLLTQAHALECRITSSCIKKISACKYWEDEPHYLYTSGNVSRSSYFTWERKDGVKCPREMPSVEVSNETVFADTLIPVRELRMPESLEEVPEKYILEANQKALKKCESEKEYLTTLYSFCG